MFHITEVDKNHSALSGLVSELDAFQSQLYPAESNHCLDFSTVDEECIRCVIAHDAAGFAAGCGAVLLQGGGFGEIKRLYIRPAYRGRRLGEQLIARLERLAAADLCHQLRLETGIHQQPAIALYRRCGYARCDAFPPYRDDPLSVFMSKSLQGRCLVTPAMLCREGGRAFKRRTTGNAGLSLTGGACLTATCNRSCRLHSAARRLPRPAIATASGAYSAGPLSKWPILAALVSR